VCITCKVETGRLLKKWHAHFRGVTCLVFSEDDSLLISGSEDGSVRVWSLFMYVMLILSLGFFLPAVVVIFPFRTIVMYTALRFVVQDI